MKDSAVLTFPLGPEDPGILVTQSVHKQLAGFSQTSQIHKKDSHIKGEKRCLPDECAHSQEVWKRAMGRSLPLLHPFKEKASQKPPLHPPLPTPDRPWKEMGRSR